VLPLITTNIYCMHTFHFGQYPYKSGGERVNDFLPVTISHTDPIVEAKVLPQPGSRGGNVKTGTNTLQGKRGAVAQSSAEDSGSK